MRLQDHNPGSDNWDHPVQNDIGVRVSNPKRGES